MKTRKLLRLLYLAWITVLLVQVELVTSQLVLGKPPVFSSTARNDSHHQLEDIQGIEGETIRLTCENAEFAASYEWRETDAAGLKISDTAQLEMRITRQMNNIVRCVARNTLGTTISAARRVGAKYLDDFDASDETVQYDVSAGIGRHFVLRRPKMLASANLDIKYAWFKDDAYQVSPNATHYITSEGDLIVTGVQKSDFGTYKVFASGEDLPEIVSAEYRVADSGMSPTVPSTLSIIHWPTDRTILESPIQRRELFDCATSLNTQRDETRIRWFLDGAAIGDNGDATTRYQLSSGGRRLAILNPDGFSKGEHKLECKADAAKGRVFDQKAAYITFVARPLLRDLPTEVQRPLGSQVSLKCAVRKTKNGDVRWFKNGVEIPTHRGKLIIDELQQSDYGIYQCETSNEAGSDLKQVWIKEGSEPGAAEMRDTPIIVTSESASSSSSAEDFVELVADLGGEVEFECAAPRIFQDVVEINAEPAKYTISGDGKLRILDLTRADEGVYKCGGGGIGYRLVLQGQTRLIEYPPKDQKSLIGTNVEFGCEVAKEYARRAQIEWFLNDVSIGALGNAGLRISRHRKGAGLVIRQVGPDNTGEYRCVVKVDGRREEASAMLQIIEKPAMPERVKAELRNETMPAKVRITWAEGFDGNEPIIKHAIEMRTLGPTGLWSDWQSVLDNIAREEDTAQKPCCWADVEDLKPSSTAEFRVIASNKHGPGKASLPTGNVTMPQQPPSAAPRNVAASARSSHSVIVQWQQPKEEQASGDVVGYVVRYRLAGYSSLSWNEKNVTSKDARNAVIDELITWREYEIQVAAYNKRGLGVFSDSIEVTTSEGVPTQAPRNLAIRVLNSTAVDVQFTAPDQQRIPGVNLGYKVQFWRQRRVGEKAEEEEELFKEVLVDPDRRQLQLIISGLEKFGHYNVTVRCFTAPGDGPATQRIPIVTEEDRPEKVDRLAIDEVYYNGALVSWAPPQRPNGRITKYTIRWWKEEEEEEGRSKEMKEIDGARCNWTIEGLQPSTRYTVDVQAHTSKGAGPLDETKFESGVPPELPGRPTALSIGEIAATSVQLHFTPGFDGHTAIRRWHVEARHGGAGGVFSAIFNVSAPRARTLHVTGLRPYTEYQLRLIAENVRGRGAPSEAARAFKTLEMNPESPGMIYAQPIASDRVQVSWTPLLANSWNGRPKGYLITYRRKNSSQETQEEWKEVRTSALRTSEYVLNDLAAYTTYEVGVFAENSFGRSATQGNAVECATFESTPASAPVALEVMADGARSLLVKWQPVTQALRNGEIVGYRVRVTTTQQSQDAQATQEDPHEIDVAGEATLMTKIDDLRPFTRYAVAIAARTIVGAGPYSPHAAEAQTAEDVPTAPDVFQCSFVSETEVRWKWTPPVEANGKILTYIISYWKSHEPRSMAIDATLPGNLLFFSATNLNANTQYTFTIKTVNSKGESDELLANVLTSSARVPIRNPPIVSRDPASRHSPHEISVTWAADADAGDDVETPIRLVQLSYQKANEDEWRTVDRKFAYARKRAQLVRLAAHSMYRVRARFFGDFAESDWSTESEWMKTLEAVPTGVARDLRATPDTPHSFRVEWTAPHKMVWNSELVGYRVSWKEYGGARNATWQSREQTKRDATSATTSQVEQEVIDGLESFRHYIVRVRLVNAEGDGPESVPAFVFVGYSVPQGSVDELTAEPTSSSSMRVRWKWRGNETMMFKVTYVPIGSVLNEMSTEEEMMIVDTTEAQLQDLRKFQQYQIKVAAYNRAGQGVATQLRARTLEDVPGAVGELEFSDVLLDSVRVRWAAPQQPNGNVVGYLVNYKGVRMLEEFKNEDQLRVDAQEYEARNLAEGVTYHFSVWAQTAAGRGEVRHGNVTIGASRLGPAAPAQPPRVTPKQSHVALTWQDANEAHDIIGHLIQAKRVAAATTTTERPKRSLASSSRPTHPIGEWITLLVTSPRDAATTKSHETSAQISYRDLQPSSFYVFRVMARNRHGVGQASGETVEQLYVPDSIPDDPFYTTWWFLALVGMAAFVLIVVFVAVLCVTGSSAKYRREKRCRSVDSLQLADGNFASFQLKGTNAANMTRSRGGGLPDLPTTRPGTTQSWLSCDRDPPAYGSVGGGGGPIRVSNRFGVATSSRGDASDAGGGGVMNMYGLATDVIPPLPNAEAMQRLSALVGGGGGANGASGEYMVTRSSDYGRVERLPSSQRGRSDISEEYDSFDDEEGDDDCDEVATRPESVDGDTIRGDGIARHYGMDETWRKVRETEVVRVAAAVASATGGSAAGRSSATESTMTVSDASTVPSSWNNHHHHQQQSNLATGFSSFV